MPAKKASREDKMYNVKLIFVGWQKKPDLVIDEEFTWDTVLKEGERLAKEHEYTTFTIQEAKPKRKPRTRKTKTDAEKPKSTVRKPRTRRKKTDEKQAK